MPEYPTNPVYNSRHYADLAAFIEAEPEKVIPLYSKRLMMEAKYKVAKRLADRFAADNPRFDRVKFLEDCGVSEDDQLD